MVGAAVNSDDYRTRSRRGANAFVLFTIGAALSGLAGCGNSSETSSRVWGAAEVRSCLEQSGASVSDNDPAYALGDTSAGTFQVGVDGDYADVALAASEKNAAETEKLAREYLETFGANGSGAHHHGNVAYWQLDETDAPIRAIEACLTDE